MSVNTARFLFQLIDDHPRSPADCLTCRSADGYYVNSDSASWPEPNSDHLLELDEPECEEDFRSQAYSDLCSRDIKDRYARMGMDPDEAPIINHELTNY